MPLINTKNYIPFAGGRRVLIMSLLFLVFVMLVLLWLVALCGPEKFLLLIAAPVLLTGMGLMVVIRITDAANNRTMTRGHGQ